MEPMATNLLAVLPFLQKDRGWAKERIWDERQVARSVGSASKAKRLLAAGTTFADQGCQLCSIATALAWLDDGAETPWNPRLVLKGARADYIGKSGVAMAPLYADLCTDLTNGRVQMLAKENFAAGGQQPRLSQVGLVRAYRDPALSPKRRAGLLVMLRIGTHDETIPSHYLLISPADAGPPDSDDALVWDPDMPDAPTPGSCTFMEAWRNFASPTADGGQRARRLKKEKVDAGRVASVYLFGRRAVNDFDSVLGAFR